MKHHPQLPHIHTQLYMWCLCMRIVYMYITDKYNCGIGSFSYQQTAWRVVSCTELADERMECHHFYSYIILTISEFCTAAWACNFCLIIIIVVFMCEGERHKTVVYWWNVSTEISYNSHIQFMLFFVINSQSHQHNHFPYNAIAKFYSSS